MAKHCLTAVFRHGILTKGTERTLEKAAEGEKNMRIVVCDDEQSARETMRAYLARYEKEQGVSFETRFFDSGEALLRDYPPMDILFLDIRMYEVSGMDIARHIRSFDDELCIIFISNMTQYALEGYRVHAFNFLVKPFAYSAFSRELTLALRKLERESGESLSVRNDSGVFQLRLREILYAETFEHKVLIHTRQKDVVCYAALSQLEKKLEGKSFFRCHQSFLIHLPAVEELLKASVRMTNGAEVPVSRHRRKELVQAMTKYAGEVL